MAVSLKCLIAVALVIVACSIKLSHQAVLERPEPKPVVVAEPPVDTGAVLADNGVRNRGSGNGNGNGNAGNINRKSGNDNGNGFNSNGGGNSNGNGNGNDNFGNGNF